MLLLINTSAEPYVVLAKEDKVIAQRMLQLNPQLGRDVLVALEEMLNEKGIVKDDIDRVAVFQGPSRYSSALRSGIMLASLFAQVQKADLIAVTEGTPSEAVVQAATREPTEASIVPQYR